MSQTIAHARSNSLASTWRIADNIPQMDFSAGDCLMKYRTALAVSVMALCFAAFVHAETITILHTNDLHSRIEPINQFDNTCPPEDNAAGECLGGYARLAAAIQQQRQEAPHSLLLDAGDQFQGSLFYTMYKGQATAELMNAVGYDAMAVGNHEFDDGPEALRTFMDSVNFPVLMANADVSAEPSLSNAVMPSTVIERGGYRYGLIGVLPDHTHEISSPGRNIKFSDGAEAIRNEIEKLNADGIDRIIVLSHSGYSVDLKIAAAVDGIDLIVGGHSNTYLSNISESADGPYPTWVETPNGGKTAIAHAYAYGKYLGRLDMTFNDQGVVTAAVGESILMDSSIPEDESIKARIAELAGPLDELLSQVVGEAATEIDGTQENCRTQSCEVGVLVAEAMLEHMKQYGVQIAITNGGGMRASIDQGPITMGELMTMLPFQNVLSRFKLTGADILATLENGVSAVEEARGRFPQIAGLRFSYTMSRAPGERIISADVMQDGQWAPIDPDSVYGVTAHDFLRGGGDGYTLLASNAIDAYDYVSTLVDSVIEYLAARSPYSARLDDRIRLE